MKKRMLFILLLISLLTLSTLYQANVTHVNAEVTTPENTSSTCETFSDTVGDANNSKTDIVSVHVADNTFVVTFADTLPYEDTNGYAVYFLSLDTNNDDTSEAGLIADYYSDYSDGYFIDNRIIYNVEDELDGVTGPIQFQVNSEISWPPDDYFPNTGWASTDAYEASGSYILNTNIDNNSIVSNIITVNVTADGTYFIDNVSMTVYNSTNDVQFSTTVILNETGNVWYFNTSLYPDGDYTFIFVVDDVFGNIETTKYVITINNVQEKSATDATGTLSSGEPGKVDTSSSESTIDSSVPLETSSFHLLVTFSALMSLMFIYKRKH